MPADENIDPARPLRHRTPDPARYGQGPKGTRDFYPLEMAKRRWIEERWRKVAVRFGFEEIDGPRFEHLDTYTVKSGEGIVSELFSFTRAGGDTEFALRPEFTPTLARMAAAKANALPKPIKWFSIGPYFRAERPQRGRLREFLQWNVDMVGDPSPEADAEVIACCVEFLRECGLKPEHVQVKWNDRNTLTDYLAREGVSDTQETVLRLLDAAPKMERREFEDAAKRARVPPSLIQEFCLYLYSTQTPSLDSLGALSADHDRAIAAKVEMNYQAAASTSRLHDALDGLGISNWVRFSPTIVRGLAYYTGTVFEVHEATGAERAIAGGGRYDNLVELFGGPSTPAVGFAMGDVVLSLVLQDKGLMPSDDEIAKELRLNPDVFVFAVDPSLDAPAASFLARCRRDGLHARRSYKATRNVGKLLKDASTQRARVAVFVEPNGDSFVYQVKDLIGGKPQETRPTLDDALMFVHELL